MFIVTEYAALKVNSINSASFPFIILRGNVVLRVNVSYVDKLDARQPLALNLLKLKTCSISTESKTFKVK